MRRFTGPLSASALRLPILHALGDLTVYRLSASAALPHLAEAVVKLVERPRAWAETAEVAYLDEWLGSGDAPLPTRSNVPPVYAGLRALWDRWNVEWKTPAVEAALVDLQEEESVRALSGSRWSLTRSSLEESVRARPVFTMTNITSAWVNGTVDGEYLSKLEAHMGSRCTRSKQFNELMELINKFFLNLIQRDGLREMLAVGNHPTPSDIRNWVYRSALSKWRDEGRDALTRAFKGCRTEKDLRLDAEDEEGDAHKDVVDRSLPSDAQGVFLAEDGEGQTGTLVSAGSSSFPLLDVVGGNLEEELIHRMTGQRGFALMEAAIRREKAGASDRFARILHMLRDDKGFQDIGKAEGVSRNRAASLVADLRDAVQRAISTSEVAVRILRYVQDEPYATIEDMESSKAEGGMGETIDVSILDSLVKANRLSREGDGCYLLTAAGASALDNEEYFGVEILAEL